MTDAPGEQGAPRGWAPPDDAGWAPPDAPPPAPPLPGPPPGYGPSPGYGPPPRYGPPPGYGRAPALPKGGSARTGPLPLHPMTLSDVLDGAFKLLKANARTVLTVTAVFVVPIQLIAAYLQRD